MVICSKGIALFDAAKHDSPLSIYEPSRNMEALLRRPSNLFDLFEAGRLTKGEPRQLPTNSAEPLRCEIEHFLARAAGKEAPIRAEGAEIVVGLLEAGVLSVCKNRPINLKESCRSTGWAPVCSNSSMAAS